VRSTIGILGSSGTGKSITGGSGAGSSCSACLRRQERCWWQVFSTAADRFWSRCHLSATSIASGAASLIARV
jgi:hypothetical protein